MALTFRVVCPHCSEPTRAPAEQFYRWWPNEGSEDEDPLVTAAIASYCPECEGLIALIVGGNDSVIRPILAEEVDPADWEFSQDKLTLKEIVPRRQGASLGRSVPKEIRAVWPDLIEDVSRKRNAVGTVTTCRGILEAALRALDEMHGLANTPSGNLLNRIDRLRDAGVITAPVAEWAHEVRLDGNQGAHELIGSPARATAYVRFLRVFLEVAFDLPERIKVLKAGRVTKPKHPPGQATA